MRSVTPRLAPFIASISSRVFHLVGMVELKDAMLPPAESLSSSTLPRISSPPRFSVRNRKSGKRFDAE